MKLNKISCLVSLFALSMAFAGCDSDDDYTRGTWDAQADYADVYFPTTSVSQELDPVDATELKIEVVRRNTAGELDVPITIISGEEGVFEVTPAHFANGDSLGVATLSFAKAEVGTPYTVGLQLMGSEYVSQYSDNTLFTYSVTRVKWNTVGENGKVAYTEDLVTTFFGVQNLTYYVEVQERDDRPGYFRVKNAYGEAYPYNEPGDYDDANDYYIFIDATNPSKVYIPMRCDLGCNWGYGNFVCYSFAGYYLEKGKAADAAAYYGKYANGTITFPPGALLFGMKEYKEGGLYTSNGSGMFKLVIDPSKVVPEAPPAYVASIESDFEWEEVFTGAFASSILGSNSEVALYTGTCVNTTDDCDKVFAEEYGTAYALNDPYGADAPIYFGVLEDGTITTPVAKQPIGVEAMGQQVYAIINPKASSFSEKLITLNITFVNKDGSINYGTANETLSNITWTTVATGNYTYTLYFGSEDEPEVDEGLELLQRDDMPSMYKITHWGMDVDYVFTWDNATNACVVSQQPIGYEHPTYGDVYVGELNDYAGQDIAASFYDPETKTFNFAVVYYVSAGNFGYGYETFTLNEGGAAKVKANKTAEPKKAMAAVKLNTSMKRASKFVGKRVGIKDLKQVDATPLL